VKYNRQEFLEDYKLGKSKEFMQVSLSQLWQQTQKLSISQLWINYVSNVKAKTVWNSLITKNKNKNFILTSEICYINHTTWFSPVKMITTKCQLLLSHDSTQDDDDEEETFFDKKLTSKQHQLRTKLKWTHWRTPFFIFTTRTKPRLQELPTHRI